MKCFVHPAEKKDERQTDSKKPFLLLAASMETVSYPTLLHQQASTFITDYFSRNPHTDTVLLTNSIARGKAVAESDLDMEVLLRPGTTTSEKAELESNWQFIRMTNTLLQDFVNAHPFLQIHLDLIDGHYEPQVWDDGGGPDYFEVEIGNHMLYSKPLTEEGSYFNALQEKWLPYYDDVLRASRLKMVKDACRYDLDHVPFFVSRGLHFQAFDRIYRTLQQFLQALFISHRTYPIAYNKWIREQVVDMLQLPELYKELPKIISVKNMESNQLNKKAERLTALLREYIPG